MNAQVDFYFRKGKWHNELIQLRHIISEFSVNGVPLTEELKWGVPCYTFNRKNIVLLHSFKDYCAVLFFKGALLGDPDKILIRQTENVQSARQVRFTSLEQIDNIHNLLHSYLQEAIDIENAGLKVPKVTVDEQHLPDEFNSKLESVKGLKDAFKKLTPGRQRAYIMYFAQAKQSKTREARIQKYVPVILSGKGMDDL